MDDDSTRIARDTAALLYDKLMVDDQWSVETDAGFVWLPWRLPQSVEVVPVDDDPLGPCAVVSITTPIVSDVSDGGKAAAAVTAANHEQSLNSVVWDPETGTINESCTGFVHDGNAGWFWRQLLTSAVLQTTTAHRRADAFASFVGGEVTEWAHPDSGPRDEPDEMLGAVDATIVPAGQGASAFEGELMVAAGQFLSQTDYVGSSDAVAFTCEVPFVGNRTGVEILASDPGAHLETSLVQITSQAVHPWLGSGAHLLMQLPVRKAEADAAALAMELNFVEARYKCMTQFLGSWVTTPSLRDDGGHSVSFHCFIPNALAGPNVLENLVLQQAVRSHFAANELFGREDLLGGDGQEA